MHLCWKQAQRSSRRSVYLGAVPVVSTLPTSRSRLKRPTHPTLVSQREHKVNSRYPSRLGYSAGFTKLDRALSACTGSYLKHDCLRSSRVTQVSVG